MKLERCSDLSICSKKEPICVKIKHYFTHYRLFEMQLASLYLPGTFHNFYQHDLYQNTVCLELEAGEHLGKSGKLELNLFCNNMQ